ncbi:MAG TPA: PqqD family protein [Acidimicrobiia bacterium]|nr:PqqD family protein [Acidimicrobiia bacterium]
MDDTTKVGPPLPNVLETELDGEVSLYSPAHEQVTILNGTATDVWYLCDGTRSEDEIVELLASSYSVAPDQIRDDVSRTIEMIRKAGLVQE